jgi:hypothetical protein
MDKLGMWKRLRFDLLFVGDDWRNSGRWEEYEKQFRETGVRIVYFPYTPHTSSSMLRQALDRLDHGEWLPTSYDCMEGL